MFAFESNIIIIIIIIIIIVIINILKNNSRHFLSILNPITPGLFEGGAAWGEGGGRGERKVPVAYNSKTINYNEIKLGGVVKDH